MTVAPYSIKKGQIWESKISGRQFLIKGKRGDRWLAHELSHKQGHYLSTHSFLPFILRQKFTLL